jgi:hypothetical protein
MPPLLTGIQARMAQAIPDAALGMKSKSAAHSIMDLAFHLCSTMRQGARQRVALSCWDSRFFPPSQPSPARGGRGLQVPIPPPVSPSRGRGTMPVGEGIALRSAGIGNDVGQAYFLERESAHRRHCRTVMHTPHAGGHRRRCPHAGTIACLHTRAAPSLDMPRRMRGGWQTGSVRQGADGAQKLAVAIVIYLGQPLPPRQSREVEGRGW